MKQSPLFLVLLACMGEACSTESIPRDPLAPCATDSDCPTGAICASDSTCWPIPDSHDPPVGAVTGATAISSPDSVVVQWTPGATSTATIVQRDGDVVEDTRVEGSQLTDPHVSVGKERTYRLEAIEGSLLSAPVYLDVRAPPPPTVRAACFLSCVQLEIPDFIGTGTLCADPGARFFRSAAGGPMLPIVLSPQCTDDSPPLQEELQYAYQLLVDGVLYESPAVPLAALPPRLAAPVATAVSTNLGVLLSWTTAAEIAAVELVTLDDGSGALASPIVTTYESAGGAQPLVPCGTGMTCLYLVRITDSQGRSADSAPVSGHGAPGAPVNLVVSGGLGQITASWSPGVGEATSFSVLAVYPNAPAFTANTTGDSLTFAAPPFQPARFSVQAHWDDVDGYAASPSNEVEAINEPAVFNPNGTPGDQALGSIVEPLSQSFRVPQGGELVLIEFEMTGPPGGVMTYLYAGPSLQEYWRLYPLPQFDVLSPERPSGVAFDVGVIVSAGETLQWVIEQPQGVRFAATSMDAYDGGAASIDGVPREGTDLAFAAFVIPSSELDPPGLVPYGVLGAAAVTWTASAGASVYHLYRTPDGGVESLLADTQEVSLLDTTAARGQVYAYRVVAEGADGGTASSAERGGVAIEDAFLDANFLDGHALIELPASAGGAHSLGQTLTVETGGQLVRIELPMLLVTTAPLLSLLDDQGVELASAQGLPADDPAASAGPLSPWFGGSMIFEFTDAGVVVAAGQQLRLRLSSDEAAYTRDRGGDPYPGGAELVNDVEVPDRDLAFKLVLK